MKYFLIILIIFFMAPSAALSDDSASGESITIPMYFSFEPDVAFKVDLNSNDKFMLRVDITFNEIDADKGVQILELLREYFGKNGAAIQRACIMEAMFTPVLTFDRSGDSLENYSSTHK